MERGRREEGEREGEGEKDRWQEGRELGVDLSNEKTLLSLTVCICDVNRPTKGSSD